MNEEKPKRKRIYRKSITSIKNIDKYYQSLTFDKKLKILPEIQEKEKVKNIVKVELDEKLCQLFSSSSSLMGYKQDIDSLLNDLHLNKNDLFKFVKEFLSKSTKKENEIRIIASYLFNKYRR